MKTGEKLYTVGEWRGARNYKCRFCSYGSLKERNVLEHLERFHPDKVRAARGGDAAPAAQPVSERRRGRQMTADAKGAVTAAAETGASGNDNQ